MITIKNQSFNSTNVLPTHTSKLDDSKMENKKIVSDNVRVNPMQLDFDIMYTNTTDIDDYRDKRRFLEDILYNREVVDVFDSEENAFYGDLVLTSLGGFEFFPNGFSCNVKFTYASITQTAVAGQKLYKGVQNRNIKYTERPLKQITLDSDSLPSDSKSLLNNMGIFDTNGSFSFPTLDVDISNFASGLGDSILTTLGNNRLNFSIGTNGALDILNEAGEFLLAGQDLIVNTELLANMIPGVDFSTQLVPVTSDAINSVFEVEKLGKDFQIVINQIKENVGDLIGT